MQMQLFVPGSLKNPGSSTAVSSPGGGFKGKPPRGPALVGHKFKILDGKSRKRTWKVVESEDDGYYRLEAVGGRASEKSARRRLFAGSTAEPPWEWMGS